ncbi:MAG: histidine phosphatase family protein [Clostridia bacterium]|nr:histidine phosphatase family protein [Clostridia bacterium]
MTLIILRHGQSEADLLDVCEGRADFNLTELGKTQVKNTSEKLAAEYKIDRIYSSTLKRAKQTAEILNSFTNIEIEYLDDLMEFNNGLIAGLPKDEAIIMFPKDPELPYDKAMYGMESQKEFRMRAEKALSYILSSTKEHETIAVVSHGGMINMLYQSFMKMPLPSVTSYGTGDAGYHIWKIENEIRTVIT